MKFFTLLALTALSLPAFAQQTCYVDMVDRYSRVVATFTANDNPDVCYEAMKECRKSIRLRPELGGVDCIKDVRRPVPVPAPRPNPAPRPQPVPQYGVEVTSLILDISEAESKSETKTKMINGLIRDINSPSLVPFIRICDGTRTWNDNAQCLVDGVSRAPREMIPEHAAINVVGSACKMTSTWSNEKMCFSSAFRAARFSSLHYYSQSCEQMSSFESASKCYRQIFGVQ